MKKVFGNGLKSGIQLYRVQLMDNFQLILENTTLFLKEGYRALDKFVDDTKLGYS